MRRVPTATGESRYLQYHYRRPLVIIEVLAGGIFRVAELDKNKNSRFSTTVHVSQLKPWWVYNEDELLVEYGEVTLEDPDVVEIQGEGRLKKRSGRFKEAQVEQKNSCVTC